MSMGTSSSLPPLSTSAVASSKLSGHQLDRWPVTSLQRKEMFSSNEESLTSAKRWALERASTVLVSRELALSSILWACDSLERLPIRLTLENVGVFALVLALLLPRALTYTLTYPIFRLVFGTLYPAYASYKAVRTKNVKEYVKWMMYWIVFALFTCAETFTDVFFSFWFPFYYEIKIILVLWLLSPATKGSSILYRRFVHPALCRREAEIDEALARATEQGYSAVLQLGTKGVNYATTVLMQTAIKTIPSVIASGALASSQSDSGISSSANRKLSPTSTSETDSPSRLKALSATEMSNGSSNSGNSCARTRSGNPSSRARVKSEQVSIVELDDEGALEFDYSSAGEERSSLDRELDMDFEIEAASQSIVAEEALEQEVFALPPEPKPVKAKKIRDDSGGGGLVQQLRKSYSLSDLTGEKDDMGRSGDEHSADQVDYIDVEPRRREKSGRRGYSPRRTQSSSNRVDMYFPEVDVEVVELEPRQTRQSRQSRETSVTGVVPTLTNVKSSDDISSGYSSGEALHSRKSPTSNEVPLVRTASVGARNRTKITRSSSKKSVEVDEQLIEETSIRSIEMLPVQNILSRLSADQVLQFLTLYSQHNQDYVAQHLSLSPDSNADDSDDEDSSTLKADPPCTSIESIQDKQEQKVKMVLDDSKELLTPQVITTASSVDSNATTETMELSPGLLTSQTNLSRSSSDCSERAGKYHKKPAPKAPPEMLAVQSGLAQDSIEADDESVEEPQPVKASLVIKVGPIKRSTEDVASCAEAKPRKKASAKESFSKLLTIPKNIFHNAFHKEREEERREKGSQRGDDEEEEKDRMKQESKEIGEEERQKESENDPGDDNKKDKSKTGSGLARDEAESADNDDSQSVLLSDDRCRQRHCRGIKEDSAQAESGDALAPASLTFEKRTDV